MRSTTDMTSAPLAVLTVLTLLVFLSSVAVFVFLTLLLLLADSGRALDVLEVAESAWPETLSVIRGGWLTPVPTTGVTLLVDGIVLLY